MRLADLIPGGRAIGLALRLVPALALVIAFGVMLASRNHHRAENRRHESCVAAIGRGEAEAVVKPLCDPILVAAAGLAESGRAFGRCEAGLAADAAAIPLACSPAVRRLGAERDAKAGEAETLRQALADADKDRRDAVDRAVTRERLSAQRKAHADAVLAAAPRGPDGLSVLDADGLCDLFGCAPAAR